VVELVALGGWRILSRSLRKDRNRRIAIHDSIRDFRTALSLNVTPDGGEVFHCLGRQDEPRLHCDLALRAFRRASS
jgi:hypothetical protein